MPAAWPPSWSGRPGLPVVGCLPRLEAAQLPSRHLGLYTAGEIAGLDGRLEALAQALEANTDLDRLLELCRRPAPEAPTDPAAPAASGGGGGQG